MNIDEKIYKILSNSKAEYLTLKQICAVLGTTSSSDRKIVADCLERLQKDYKIIFDERNHRYKVVSEEDFGKAVFSSTNKGFGFLLMDDGNDLFVPANKTHGAFHKDVVLYKRVEGTVDEAEIVKIISRGMTRIVGTYDKQLKYGFVIPDEKKFISDIFVPMRADLNARNGQKVVAEITHYPTDNRNNPEGKIVQVLGYPNEKNVDVMSIAYSFGLSKDFPSAVQNRASTLPQTVLQKDIDGRRDLRNQITFTIDGEDAKDLDDAVSCVKNDDGTFTLGVHIADVSNYVIPGGEIDKEAFSRGTSVYLPQTVLPMLPVELSNGICSLYQGVDRLTVSCEMIINSKGKVLSYDIFPSVINSKHRMTYTDVQAIFDGDQNTTNNYADIVPMLLVMKELAEILQNQRNLRGNIDFAGKEVYFIYDDNGEVIDVKPYQHTFAHQLIEEFMIVANESVADYAANFELPFVYRVHENPDEEKIETLLALMKGVGIRLKPTQNITSSYLQEALSQAQNTPYFNLINDVMLRTMQKAKYSTVNIGHFGLASKRYCHFTSPIRRYPDLVVHRILKTSVFGKMTEKALRAYEDMASDTATQASIREKLATEAERKADDMKKCQYASRLVGQSFDAIVSGVTENGIFCALPNTVEGFISLDNLGGMFTYDKKRFCLYNEAKTYSLGDSIKITISSVNISACKIDFLLCNE